MCSLFVWNVFYIMIAFITHSITQRTIETLREEAGQSPVTCTSRRCRHLSHGLSTAPRGCLLSPWSFFHCCNQKLVIWYCCKYKTNSVFAISTIAISTCSVVDNTSNDFFSPAVFVLIPTFIGKDLSKTAITSSPVANLLSIQVDSVLHLAAIIQIRINPTNHFNHGLYS